MTKIEMSTAAGIAVFLPDFLHQLQDPVVYNEIVHNLKYHVIDLLIEGKADLTSKFTNLWQNVIKSNDYQNIRGEESFYIDYLRKNVEQWPGWRFERVLIVLKILTVEKLYPAPEVYTGVAVNLDFNKLQSLLQEAANYKIKGEPRLMFVML